FDIVAFGAVIAMLQRLSEAEKAAGPTKNERGGDVVMQSLERSRLAFENATKQLSSEVQVVAAATLAFAETQPGAPSYSAELAELRSTIERLTVATDNLCARAEAGMLGEVAPSEQSLMPLTSLSSGDLRRELQRLLAQLG